MVVLQMESKFSIDSILQLTERKTDDGIHITTASLPITTVETYSTSEASLISVSERHKKAIFDRGPPKLISIDEVDCPNHLESCSDDDDDDDDNDECDDGENTSSCPSTPTTLSTGDQTASLLKKSISSSKKSRTAFTKVQLQILRKKFEEQKYLTKQDRTDLAVSIGLTEKHVKTWFQNRRTKWKKDCSDKDWSKHKEHSAALMYSQFMDTKSKESCDAAAEANS